jgi:bacillolysin
LHCLALWHTVCGGGISAIAQAKFKPKYLRENNKAFADLATRTTDDGWIEFRTDKAKINANTFFDLYGSALGLDNNYRMKLEKDKADVKENRHQRFVLYYKNIRVEGADYALHSRPDGLRIAHGRIPDGLTTDVGKAMPESKALDFALADQKLSAKDFKGQDKLPKGELILTSVSDDMSASNMQLAYIFEINLLRIYVDADSGKILKRISLQQSCFNPNHQHTTNETAFGQPSIQAHLAVNANKSLLLGGTFTHSSAKYGGTVSNPGQRQQSFEIEGVPGNYWLTMSSVNPTVSPSLQTRVDTDDNNVFYATPQSNPAITWDFNNPIGSNSSTDWGTTNQAAVTAHWVSYRAYEYFRNSFNINGLNGQGRITRIWIMPGLRDNAVFSTNGEGGYLGFGVSTVTQRSLATVDIVGHEYGHGLSRFLIAGLGDGLINSSEARALNEGFSDIFGIAMERRLIPEWNWTLGEDVNDNRLVRNMANPAASGRVQPITYQGNNWDFSPIPIAQINSGVLSRWFHLIASPSSTAFDDGMQIVVQALDYYLNSASTYTDAMNATYLAAGDLFNKCSPQQKAVANAWSTVGNGLLNLPNRCDPACDFDIIPTTVLNAACNQVVTLNTFCTGPSSACPGINYSFTGPNVPYNNGPSSMNVTTPNSNGTYTYSVKATKSSCFSPTKTFNINVNCQQPPDPCDFSTPRYVGTWYGLTVQIRRISNKNVLVTAINDGSGVDKYYPRGDNFWYSFTPDPNAVNLQSCLNAGNTDYSGLSFPGGIAPPPNYTQGRENDGAIFFTNGGSPPDPCALSLRQVGTWNGLLVQIRQFPNNKRALVTAVAGSSNDKYYPRGDNFWDNFTKDPGADQYRVCLNAGDTDWWGLTFPGISTPSGYQQGRENDGAIFFSTNGQRVAAPAEIPDNLSVEDVALVKVRPNPAQTEITVSIQLDAPESVPMRLLDMQGRAVQQHTVQGVTGLNERVLNVAALPTGTYMLDVRVGNQRIVQKVVKE